MCNKTTLKNFMMVLLSLIAIPSMFAQTSVSGIVSDAATGETILGATIIIEGTSSGTLSDYDGSYSLQTDKAPPFNLVISYTGYSEQKVEITGSNDALDIKIEQGSMLDEVVVSASRKAEKVQDAPASVSIIGTKEIESTSVVSPISLLESTPGVSIEKQGGARTNISMRGGSDLFSTSTYVLMDYRSLVGVGLNTFDATQTALSTIDVEKVEAVRGPGSALWGPGVTAGVAHFITKNPFKYPGGTIEIVGGNLNTLRISGRYAGHTDDYKFGYKINALYATNGEWELDPNDATDAATMATFQDNIIDPLTGETVRNTGGQLTTRGFAYGTNLTLYYRPNDKLSLIGSGGFNYSEGLFWNAQGEGYQASTDYFGQFRTQYDFGKFGNLFGQIYYNANIAPSDISKKGFLFRSGNVSVIDRAQLEIQLQHNFDINPIRTNFVIGTDIRQATFDTETRTFGRNEQSDEFNIYGGYIQTKTELVKNKLDLVLAGRYDSFNAIDENAFSPRAALVYKLKDNMTMRASYNRAYAANSNLELNIDFQLANAGAFDIWLYGNKNAQTFDNPSTTWFVPGLGETEGVGMDIGTSYGFITAAIAGEIQAGNQALLPLAPLLPILSNSATIDAIAATGAFTQGIPIDLDGNLLNIENTTVSKLREDNTLELGFTGIFAKKLSVGVDLYQIKRKNFTGLRQISPLVVLPTLGADLNTNIVPTLTAIFTQLGIPNAAATAAQVGGAYQGTADAITVNPLGVVETDQVPGANDDIDTGLPHMAFGYRNFGKVTYYGMDLSLGYQATNEIKTFANYSWVNKNSFTGSDIGEAEGSTNRYELNFAQHKVRAGASYEQSGDQGFLGGLNMAYNSEFNSTLGFYVGPVESRFLVDANVGYKLKQGIFLNLAVDNIFNKKYRTFPSMPEIGTRILATIRYTFKPKSKTK